MATAIGKGGIRFARKYSRETFEGRSKKRKGMALKFVSPGMNGVPDRIVLMPDGKMAFVELKAPGKKPRPLQLKRKRMLERLGFPGLCS